MKCDKLVIVLEGVLCNVKIKNIKFLVRKRNS